MKFRPQLASLVIAGTITVASVANGQQATRDHQLSSGETVNIPRDAVAIPGEPLIVPRVTVEAMERTRTDYERLGYVDMPNGEPAADVVLRNMITRVETNGFGDDSQVYRLSDIRDDLDYPIGKIDEQYLRNDTETYVSPAVNALTRIYTDTEFGALLIHELFGNVELGSATSQPSNLSIAGFEGYTVTNRYAGDRFATLFLLKTRSGAAHIEVGSSPDDLSSKSRLEAMIATFLTVTERQ
jgi:hypothetical protein